MIAFVAVKSDLGEVYYRRELDFGWYPMRYCIGCIAMILYYSNIQQLEISEQSNLAEEATPPRAESSLNDEGVRRFLAKIRGSSDES